MNYVVMWVVFASIFGAGAYSTLSRYAQCCQFGHNEKCIRACLAVFWGEQASKSDANETSGSVRGDMKSMVRVCGDFLTNYEQTRQLYDCLLFSHETALENRLADRVEIDRSKIDRLIDSTASREAECCQFGHNQECVSVCQAVFRVDEQGSESRTSKTSESVQDDAKSIVKACGSALEQRDRAQTRKLYTCLMDFAALRGRRRPLEDEVGDLSTRPCCYLATTTECRDVCLRATGMEPDRLWFRNSCVGDGREEAMRVCLESEPVSANPPLLSCSLGILPVERIPVGLSFITPSLISTTNADWDECVCKSDGVFCSKSQLQLKMSTPDFSEYSLSCSNVDNCRCDTGDCESEELRSAINMAFRAGVRGSCALISLKFSAAPLNLIWPSVAQFFPAQCTHTLTVIDGTDWILLEGDACLDPARSLAVAISSGQLTYLLPGVVRVSAVRMVFNEPSLTTPHDGNIKDDKKATNGLFGQSI